MISHVLPLCLLFRYSRISHLVYYVVCPNDVLYDRILFEKLRVFPESLCDSCSLPHKRNFGEGEEGVYILRKYFS